MSEQTIVRRPFQVNRSKRSKGQAVVQAGETTVSRAPRIARLMALAIHFEELLATGAVRDQAELARLGQVSRARLTQIMNLNLLAPEIQEQLLHLSSKVAICLRQLQPLTALSDWRAQRSIWRSGNGLT